MKPLSSAACACASEALAEAFVRAGRHELSGLSCGEATKHIGAIVKSIQRDTQDAVEAMERSTRGVVEGTKTADEADRALREIEQVSNQLAELIGAISNATDQQAASARRVAVAMQEILAITQLTTDGTRTTAASAERLTELANGLRASVAGFKLA